MALAKQLGIEKQDVLALFYELCDELQHWNIETVAEDVDMWPSGLYKWLAGETVGRFENIVKVGRAIGMELQWVSIPASRKSKKKSKPSLRVIK